MKLPTVLSLICAFAPFTNFANAQQTTTTTTTTTYVPTSTVVGARVMGSQGDEVGQISDVVLDKQSGCMAYVVLATDQGGARKMVAAPWSIFSPGTDNRTYTVTVDRQKIYSAPVWESSRIDEYSRAEWIGNVYSYYGVQPQQGLNIHANVGVNTERRDETNVNARVRQTERTEGQTRERTETGRTQRNADMLTQPSPGRSGHRSAETQNEGTRRDNQTQRQQRRAERRSSNEGANADESRPSPGRGGDRAERPAEGQAQATDSPGRSAEHSEDRQSNPDRQSQSGDMDQNRHEAPSGGQRPDRNAQEQRTSPETSTSTPPREDRQTREGGAQGGERTHSQRDQQERKSGAHASPTP